METSFYSINMQKLLHIVEQLHEKGYGHLKVLPFEAPNGFAWRCMFYNGQDGVQIPVSNWLSRKFPTLETAFIETPISQIATEFENDNTQFLESCKGEDIEYKTWYSEMLKMLQPDELPLAFGEYRSPTTYWRTTHENKIPLLQKEINYLTNKHL